MESNLKLDFLGGWASRIVVWFSGLKDCGGFRFFLEKSAHSSSLQRGEAPGQRNSYLHTVRKFHQLQLTQNCYFQMLCWVWKLASYSRRTWHTAALSNSKHYSVVQYNTVFSVLLKYNFFAWFPSILSKKGFFKTPEPSQITTTRARTALPHWVPRLL